MTPDDYLLAAWRRGAPNSVGAFPTGFWPDVARVAVEMALGLPLSRQTMATKATDEGKAAPKVVKGLDVSKLEFKL